MVGNVVTTIFRASTDRKLEKQSPSDLTVSADSENIFLEDMLLEAIDAAIEAASRQGDLSASERQVVIEQASSDFIKRVESRVAQIVRELS